MVVPIYEYRCRKCGYKFEVLQWGFDGGTATRCERCKGPVEKLMSSATVIYKGSGFYTTDYGRGSGGNGGKPKTDWKEKIESESKGSSSTEKKPAVADKKD